MLELKDGSFVIVNISSKTAGIRYKNVKLMSRTQKTIGTNYCFDKTKH